MLEGGGEVMKLSMEILLQNQCMAENDKKLETLEAEVIVLKRKIL